MKKPIAKQLAEKFGGEWKAIRDGFGWMWKGPSGREVRCYSQLTPRHDSDDETCMTVYINDSGVTVGSHGMIY